MFGMPSIKEQARRALVSLLRALAATYAVNVDISRDSDDKDIRSAYRKISVKTHPDRNQGRDEHQKSLNAA